MTHAFHRRRRQDKNPKRNFSALSTTTILAEGDEEAATRMKTATATTRIVLMHWFRKGLRLHDNPALLHSLQQLKQPSSTTTSRVCTATAFYPVYVLDGNCYALKHCTALRANFLVECLQDLDANLRQSSADKSRLYVLSGDPVVVLPELWTQWGVTHLSFEADETGEPYAVQRDQAILAAAQSMGIQVHSVASETLYPIEDYYDNIKSAAVPATMTGFQKLFHSMPQPLATVLAAPTAQSFPPANNDDKNLYLPPTHPTQLPWPRNTPRAKVEPLWNATDCHNLTPLVRGGETAARQALQSSLQNATYVATFSKPHTSYTSLAPSTTSLSPYLSTGCLSPREAWTAIAQAVERAPQTVAPTKPPVSLHGQLLWRDFNNLMANNANQESPGSWGHIAGNKYCRDTVIWDDDPLLLQAWKEGRTGYPWIDACMRQLATQGWIHHLGRHAVACFLTRGDLWQSWEQGALHFEGALLDADYSLNGFNWLWLSCSGFFYQYFRCYSPVSFAKKNDPSGRYIRHFVPELAHLPDAYIYQPWEAAPNVLAKAGIVLGLTYPHPIVDHATASKANMGRMKQAYDAYKGKEQARNGPSNNKKKARKK